MTSMKSPRRIRKSTSLLISLLLLTATLTTSAGAAQVDVRGTWSHMSPASSPSARYRASLAYDPGSSKLLLFGGFSIGAVHNDTWTWDGSSWTQVNPTTSPSGRDGASMAYDPINQQIILFGGLNTALGVFNDTWVWTGSTWTQLSPIESPPARAAASMAYDPSTSQLILFGGADATGGLFGDTWAWNGTNWVELSPQHSPSAHASASMAYDTGTDQLILFGGSGSNGAKQNDTWSWTGSDWIQLSPATSPPARAYANMDYDTATDQLILFGGSGSDGGKLGDTWAWDGSNWSQQSFSTNPTARYTASMAYDQSSTQMILFGGVDASSTFLGDTWALTPNTDNTAPITDATAVTTVSSPYTFGNWTNQEVTVTLTATDAGWGVAETDYTIDNGTTQTYSTPFSIAAPGTHTITYWSVDQAGNTETPPQTADVNIDQDAPTTTATAKNADNTDYTFGDWTSQGVNVTLSATDQGGSDGVTTYYTIDMGAKQTYTGSFTVSGDGSHTISYWSEDAAGNTETAQTAKLNIDSSAPVTTASASNTDQTAYSFESWTNQAVTVTLSATESGGSSIANTFYTIDGSQNTYASPFTISTEGDHTVTFWSTDDAGNVETANIVQVKIDTSAPDISGHSSPSPNVNGWNNTDVTVTFTCSDPSLADSSPGSGVASCTTPGAVSTEGANQSVAGSTADNAANSANTTVTGINIDKTAPTVTYSGNGGSYTVDQTVNITCVATDALSGVLTSDCHDITGPAYSFAGGTNTFSASATDNAGNVGTGTVSFTVRVSVSSLSALTAQFETNWFVNAHLQSILANVQRWNNTQLKSFFVNMYIVSVNTQRGRTLTNEQADILVRLAKAL